MILIIYILTPFTMTHSIHLFQGFRIIQTRMDGADNPPWSSTQSQAEVNFGRVCRSSTPAGHHSTFSQPVFQTTFPASQRLHPVYPHPKHATKFYLGSAMHHTLDREYSRSRKYFQLTHERLVQAELALRYTGMNTTICIFGLRFPSIPTEWTIAASK